MDPITIGMLGFGALNAESDLQREKRQTKLASETQRYSPWTGLRANDVAPANPIGDLAQAGAGALAYNQDQKVLQGNQALQAAQIAAMGSGKIAANGQMNPNAWSKVGQPAFTARAMDNAPIPYNEPTTTIGGTPSYSRMHYWKNGDQYPGASYSYNQPYDSYDQWQGR